MYLLRIQERWRQWCVSDRVPPLHQRAAQRCNFVADGYGVFGFCYVSGGAVGYVPGADASTYTWGLLIIIQYIRCRSSCQIHLQTYIYSIQHFRGDQGLKIAYHILNDNKT